MKPPRGLSRSNDLPSPCPPRTSCSPVVYRLRVHVGRNEILYNAPSRLMHYKHALSCIAPAVRQAAGRGTVYGVELQRRASNNGHTDDDWETVGWWGAEVAARILAQDGDPLTGTAVAAPEHLSVARLPDPAAAERLLRDLHPRASPPVCDDARRMEREEQPRSILRAHRPAPAAKADAVGLDLPAARPRQHRRPLIVTLLVLLATWLGLGWLVTGGRPAQVLEAVRGSWRSTAAEVPLRLSLPPESQNSQLSPTPASTAPASPFQRARPRRVLPAHLGPL